MAKTSEIKIKVALDKENVPEKIHWSASDGPNGAKDAEAKAFLLSIFDKEHKDTCLLYTSPSPRDRTRSRMPSSA